MTKRLILTRHAKSSWDDPLQSDHERPLNARGHASAQALGDWLASRGLVPGEAISSDALRTRETWAGIAPRLPSAPEAIFKPALYNAGPDVILAVLRHATADTVLLLGHNPGIGEFAARIAAQPPLHEAFHRYPTGATLVVSFEIDDWKEAGFGLGSVRDFVVPRDLL